MTIADIIEVTEEDFEFQVIQYSETLPVIVDFWAEWSDGSKKLDPVLRKFAQESGGSFRLAKVNVDENPNLAVRFGIRGIPTVNAFRNREIVAEFTGLRTEKQIKDFLSRIEAHPMDLIMRKAESLLAQHNWERANEAFIEVITKRPDYPPALLGMSKTYLALGNADRAYHLLNNFPASKEYPTAETLLPLVEAISHVKETLPYSEDILNATFNRAIRLFLQGNYSSSMDGLLDIIRDDKSFRNGEAKRVLLAIFEILGNKDPLTIKYRKELASILF